ncbi:diaminopimelate epimerase [Clostridium sp. Marseille-Q2269]|uniref:diaminopimelate epimerase n=1 Tax=Clostridium sp. Marseille-Q2269 TaxID=2942205 RepID=UPI0020744CF0|nr:diaminopimelate epimerase [Clostridium sp. Marseille-Q2269]
MEFTKMTGTGNDFVVLDDRKGELIGKEKEITQKLCNRHFSIGADGILFIRESNNHAHIQMVIINADGSYASMCGNGIRCFAKYVWENGIVKQNPMIIQTGDGPKEAFLNIEDGKVKFITINMGKPAFEGEKISNEKEKIINKSIRENNKEYRITSFHMGVPHTIIFGSLDEYNIEEGKNIEKLPLFKEGTNVNFCEVVNKNKIKVKTWERGAGPTLACGTGCCASAVASNLLDHTEKSTEVIVPGGKIFIEIKENGVFMKGPADICFRGEIDV